ncbi:hypothetical protein ZWY2020_043790 [Hordeum vulgare]|nr:hypothetical protein ZWY2020_043790 [Hordeum vulgare]
MVEVCSDESSASPRSSPREEPPHAGGRFPYDSLVEFATGTLMPEEGPAACGSAFSVRNRVDRRSSCSLAEERDRVFAAVHVWSLSDAVTDEVGDDNERAAEFHHPEPSHLNGGSGGEQRRRR